MTNLLRLIVLVACLQFSISCSAEEPKQATITDSPSLPSAQNPPYPPLEHSAIKLFAAAVGLPQQVAKATDTFWLPGAEILRELNPGLEQQVERLVSRIRAKGDQLYVATAVFQVDKNVTRFLVPDVATAEAQAIEQMRRTYQRTRKVDSPEQTKLAAMVHEKSRRARPVVTQRLIVLTRQAKTPAGAAWLSGLTSGNYRCLDAFRSRAGNQAFADQLRKQHCQPIWTSTYDHLLATKDGRDFAQLSSMFYVSAIAAMQMSFDAGLSLERFLPPNDVKEAGLAYPSTSIGPDELMRRYSAMVKR